MHPCDHISMPVHIHHMLVCPCTHATIYACPCIPIICLYVYATMQPCMHARAYPPYASMPMQPCNHICMHVHTHHMFVCPCSCSCSYTHHDLLSCSHRALKQKVNNMFFQIDRPILPMPPCMPPPPCWPPLCPPFAIVVTHFSTFVLLPFVTCLLLEGIFWIWHFFFGKAVGNVSTFVDYHHHLCIYIGIRIL